MPDIAGTTDPVATTLAIVALLIALAVLALLVLVLVGIHHEERHMSLTSAPRTRIGAITRHLTGIGVRTPEADPCKDQDPDSCPGRHLT
jgi:type II secretory pathway component PulJ